MVNFYSNDPNTLEKPTPSYGTILQQTVKTANHKELYLCAVAESIDHRSAHSLQAVDTVISAMINGLKRSRARKIPLILRDAINQAHDALRHSQDSFDASLPACLLSIAVIHNNELFIASVGSSEVLLYQDEKVKWLQTKYSTPLPNQAVMIGQPGVPSIRSIPPLDENRIGSDTFAGLSLKADAKLLVSSSSIIDFLIMHSHSYFADIEQLLKVTTTINYTSRLDAWRLENDIPDDALISIFFNEAPIQSSVGSRTLPASQPVLPSSSLSAKVESQEREIEPSLTQPLSSEEEDAAEEIVEEDIAQQTRPNSAIGLEAQDLGNKIAAEWTAETIDPIMESINAEEPHRASLSNFEAEALSDLEKIDIQPDTLYDPGHPQFEMTRQSPVQIARAAFPILDQLEVDDGTYPAPKRMSSVQIFFSIFIILSLTILVVIVLTAVWGEIDTGSLPFVNS